MTRTMGFIVVIAGGIVAAVFTGLVLAFSMAPDAPIKQSDFPCQEDEVLGYHPRFGPDDVGCMHVEEL